MIVVHYPSCHPASSKMHRQHSLLVPFFFLTFFTAAFCSSHFTKQSLHLRRNASGPQRYVELTRPPIFSKLTPTCTLPVLSHSFGNTYGLPPVSVSYSPPPNCSWTDVVLEFKVSSQGDQYDRIAAVWLHGAELLRTSTAEPTDDGVFWQVQKDVTRYTSLLLQSKIRLSVMLENIVNDVFTGVYQVNVTFLYYEPYTLSLPSGFGSEDPAFNPITLNLENKRRSGLDLYAKPADLIIPISARGDQGFWFRIDKPLDVYSKGIQIPPNTYKAVMEIYVSFHGSDEFWYSNPPDSYIQVNNLTTERGHGAYREILLTIDGNLVGAVVPVPVIFTGGINPLMWEPVVSIGAFDLPTYDFDLTPSLEMLLDGNIHNLGLAVEDSIPFWFVNGNLHLWLDHGSARVEAKTIDSGAPSFSIRRTTNFAGLDGSCKIVMKRRSSYSAWVKSSFGNLTTRFMQELRFDNMIKFSNNGTEKFVKQKVNSKNQLRIHSDTGSPVSRISVRRVYPMTVYTSTQLGQNETSLMTTSVDHELKERKSDGQLTSSLGNSQQSEGWMVVKDHDVLNGGASTNQSYFYRENDDCFSRVLAAANGQIIKDTNDTGLCGIFS